MKARFDAMKWLSRVETVIETVSVPNEQHENYGRLYLTTSLIAASITSLYCIAACKHCRTKSYFRV